NLQAAGLVVKQTIGSVFERPCSCLRMQCNCGALRSSLSELHARSQVARSGGCRAARGRCRVVIDFLCSQLPATFCEIDQLAAILLRFCRDHAEHLREAYDRDEVGGLMYDESDRIEDGL